jgi:hypothetical protein
VFPAAGVFQIANILAVSVGVAIIVSFSRALVVIFQTEGVLPPGHILALGISTQWIGTIIRQSAYYFGGGYDGDGGLNTVNSALLAVSFPIWSIGLWLSIVGGVTILTAIGQEDSRDPFPTRPFVNLGIIVAIVLCVLGAAMWWLSIAHFERGIKFPQWCADCHTLPRTHPAPSGPGPLTPLDEFLKPQR